MRGAEFRSLSGLQNGSYDAVTDFRPYAVKGFPFKLFNRLYAGSGCGQTALALLTGIEPKKLGFKKGERLDDHVMVSYLQDEGFTVLPITKCDVSKDVNLIGYHIYPDHVVLISSLVAREDTTWAVLYDNYIIHNFLVEQQTALEFLNNPLRSAYVVWKPEWALSDSGFYNIRRCRSEHQK